MTRLQTSTALAVFLLITAGAAAGQTVPGAPPVDWDKNRQEYSLSVLKEYNIFMDDWRALLGKSNAAELSQRYDEGAFLLVSGHDVVQGRDSIHALLRRVMPGIVELQLGLSDFVASDRLAYASGPLIYRFSDSANGSVRAVHGNHVTVLVRDGKRWRIRSQVLKYENRDS
jgi:ketosteroid isomerase-like protein